MSKQYLSDRKLAERYEVSRQTIWRWAQNCQLPKPIKINGSTRWILSDIEKWERTQESMNKVQLGDII